MTVNNWKLGLRQRRLNKWSERLRKIRKSIKTNNSIECIPVPFVVTAWNK